jgi:hypothetical protein
MDHYWGDEPQWLTGTPCHPYPHHSYIGTLNNSNLFVEVVVMNVEQIQSSLGLTYKKMTSDFKSWLG